MEGTRSAIRWAAVRTGVGLAGFTHRICTWRVHSRPPEILRGQKKWREERENEEGEKEEKGKVSETAREKMGERKRKREKAGKKKETWRKPASQEV